MEKGNEEELQLLKEHVTWNLLKTPENKKIVVNKLLYKIKSDESGGI